MERLYKIAGLVLTTVCASAAFASAAVAQDYCSLKVRVVTPAGGRPEVPVVVKEKNGRTIQKEQDARSEEVLFCDLGILPVTVIVGQEGCNQIKVKDVPLSWQEPYTLIVNYDIDPCIKESLPLTPLCDILLRIANTRGEWVKRARIRFDDTAHSERETDIAGRALFSLKLNGHLKGSVTAPGYARKEFSFGCSEVRNREEILTLEGK